MGLGEPPSEMDQFQGWLGVQLGRRSTLGSFRQNSSFMQDAVFWEAALFLVARATNGGVEEGKGKEAHSSL